ncbi:pyridoxamine 5'-phosphate oxidase family protein [Actinomycetospora chiangmaiensis]|uniref:pyridoxamine 5'-phosphate oxidase family protein n=1 Tax=Actinomycetospora chiangmaiensis TaxID=402650 RepID=UPI00037EE5D5|nr:pyridoxamine 5'-phosphate oxidase family protein [Actinomycetospora chiangmaiensis]
MDARTVAETLAQPIAQELLFSDIPARLSYVGLDGDPRVVPTAFWWNGTSVVITTVPRSAKVAAITAHPRVAVAVDRPGMPPRSLLIRGRAEIEVVDGVREEFVAAARKITPAEAMPQWEAGVRALYLRTAVLTIIPDHVVLHDFETTIPKAVADLVAGR